MIKYGQWTCRYIIIKDTNYSLNVSCFARKYFSRNPNGYLAEFEISVTLKKLNQVLYIKPEI